MIEGHKDRLTKWRYPVPFFSLIISRFHAEASKVMRCPAYVLPLFILLAAILLAVASTLGYAQEPMRICVDFSDWKEGVVEAEFIKEGFVFTAIDDEPQHIDLVDTPEEVLGLYIAEEGVNIGFPQTTSQVTINAVSGTAVPIEIYAFNPEDTVVDKISLSIPDNIHTLTLSGKDIVRLVIREGGNEAFLIEICIEIKVEEVAEGPFIEVVDPPEGDCGSEIQLSIFGANFEPRSIVFIPEGIETLYTEFISSEELRAGVFIAKDAPLGARPVIVSGPELGEAIFEGGFTVICMPPEVTGQPDLAIINLDWVIAEEGRLLLITAQVINAGDVQAPEVTLHAESQSARWWSAEAIVPELPDDTSAQVVIESVIPDELRGSTHLIRVDVDPANRIIELDEENNWRDIEVSLPPLPVTTPPTRWSDLWLPIIGGAFTILVGTLSTRRVMKARRHKKWQNEAKEEPQEPCEPGTICCQKIESKCKLARCNIKHLRLVAYDAVSGELRKEKQIQGEIVKGLNNVIADSRRGAKLEELEEQVTSLARALLQQIIEWLRPESAPRDVSVTGHLEGCQVTYKFKIKRCKETRTWGEAEEEWKVTITEERDEPLAALPNLEPTKLGIPEQLAAELTRKLMLFIEKV